MSDPNIEICERETYETAIQNSVGTSLFNSLFVRKRDTGEIIDITENGEYSCAFFVSNILVLAGLLKKAHATVSGLERKIKDDHLWKKINPAHSNLGDVIIWDKITHSDGLEHAHCGFVLDAQDAMSTSDRKKMVIKHPMGYRNRPITAVYSYQW